MAAGTHALCAADLASPRVVLVCLEKDVVAVEVILTAGATSFAIAEILRTGVASYALGAERRLPFCLGVLSILHRFWLLSARMSPSSCGSPFPCRQAQYSMFEFRPCWRRANHAGRHRRVVSGKTVIVTSQRLPLAVSAGIIVIVRNLSTACLLVVLGTN